MVGRMMFKGFNEKLVEEVVRRIEGVHMPYLTDQVAIIIRGITKSSFA